MRPRYLVYILSAIIIAFVVRGYSCAEEMKCSLQCIEHGGHKAVDFNALYASIEGFKAHLLLSVALAVVITVCCKHY